MRGMKNLAQIILKTTRCMRPWTRQHSTQKQIASYYQFSFPLLSLSIYLVLILWYSSLARSYGQRARVCIDTRSKGQWHGPWSGHDMWNDYSCTHHHKYFFLKSPKLFKRKYSDNHASPVHLLKRAMHLHSHWQVDHDAAVAPMEPTCQWLGHGQLYIYMRGV